MRIFYNPGRALSHPNSPAAGRGCCQAQQSPDPHQLPRLLGGTHSSLPGATQQAPHMAQGSQWHPSLTSYRQGLAQQFCGFVPEVISCSEGEGRGAFSRLSRLGLPCPPESRPCQALPFGTISHKKGGKCLSKYMNMEENMRKEGNCLPFSLIFLALPW